MAAQVVGAVEAIERALGAAAAPGAGDRRIVAGTGEAVAPADAVAAALAAEAAGGLWCLAGSTAARAAGPAVRLCVPGEEAASRLPPVVELPAARPSWLEPTPAAELARRLESAAAKAAASAGFLAEPGADGADRADATLVAAVAQASAGERLAERLAGDGAGARRPIAVASLDLATRDGRTVLSWALAAEAALLLEADPRDVPGTAAWARPTVVAVRAAGARALAARATREAARRSSRAAVGGWLASLGLGRPAGGAPAGPPPLGGRLEALVLLGAERLGTDELAFWLERGVRVVPAVV